MAVTPKGEHNKIVMIRHFDVNGQKPQRFALTQSTLVF